MRMSIVNHTKGKLSDEAVQDGIRAVNRQIAHDFMPHWHMSAELRLEGAVGASPHESELPELRGDAIIYLWNGVDVDDAIGYHDTHARGIPFGFVFTDLAEELGESWTVTLSHEALELLGDPEVNLLVAGPHPGNPKKEVFHWYEMCDAVQAETYKVDGIEVSNFLLPLYFTSSAEQGGRNDFLGRLYKGKSLRSFNINPGGYIGFYNPATKQHETFALKDDEVARKRLAIKRKARLTRRSVRYKAGLDYGRELDSALAKPVKRKPGAKRVRAAAPRPLPQTKPEREVEMIDVTEKRAIDG